MATAWYLQKARPDFQITVLEAENRLGGTILTTREKDFLIEGGPDSFVTTKPWALELCKELGVEGQLIGTNPKNRKVYVLNKGMLEELPTGMALTVPTKIAPFLKSKLISPKGKVRMAMDLVLPRKLKQEDESLGSFVKRRLGKEALEKIAEPLMGGIFISDADSLSLLSTFPQFIQLEKNHRSLILGMMRQKKQSSSVTSMFMTLKNGMYDLVRALVSKMPKVTFITDSPVEKISRQNGKYVIKSRGQSTEADAVVVSTPAPQAAKIVQELDEGLASAIKKIDYVSSATVAMAFPTSVLKSKLDGTGFIIPKGEKRKIVACTWSSLKFDHRAPESYVLLRAFLGGEWGKSYVDMNDSGITELVKEELRSIMNISWEPEIVKIFTWKEANPLYQVGHSACVKKIESIVEKIPGLYLTGAGYRGVGIPDCVHDAFLVASVITKTIRL